MLTCVLHQLEVIGRCEMRSKTGLAAVVARARSTTTHCRCPKQLCRRALQHGVKLHTRESLFKNDVNLAIPARTDLRKKSGLGG